MAAPFDPLPFDPRNACPCHRGCPTFHKATTRIWFVVGGAPPPFEFLSDGILFLIGVIGPGPPDLCGPLQNCAYVPATIPAPMTSGFMCKLFPLDPPVPGTRWKITINFDGFADYVAADSFPGVTCDSDLGIPFVSGPFGPLDAAITQVEWFENANDVPH